MNYLLSVLAGLVCGVLSGFGIGGGSLLMLWMTSVAALSQKTAQGVNLLYFLPTAGSAVLLHRKNGVVCGSVAVPAAIVGCLVGGVTAFFAVSLSGTLLQKLFGGFLLFIGCTELFGAAKEPQQPLTRSLSRDTCGRARRNSCGTDC